MSLFLYFILKVKNNLSTFPAYSNILKRKYPEPLAKHGGSMQYAAVRRIAFARVVRPERQSWS